MERYFGLRRYLHGHEIIIHQLEKNSGMKFDLQWCILQNAILVF
jgi:hypothetical protein